MPTEFNLQIIQDGVTKDLSNYVSGCDDIPIYYERNNNWEPIISTFKFTLSQASPITPAKNEVITFYIDGELKFTGFIETMITNYQSRTYSCEVASKLRYLQNKRLERTYDSSSLYTFIADTANINEYNPSETWTWYFEDHWIDSAGLRGVQMLWLLKACFTSCDMSLDTTEVDEVVVARDRTGTRGNYVYTDIKTKEIVMDLDSVWCINQDMAADYTKINTDHSDSKISLYDLLRIVCGYLGFVVVPTGISSYQLIHKSGLENLDIDSLLIKASYNKTVTNPKYDSVENNYRYTRRDKYYPINVNVENSLDIPSEQQTERQAKNYMGALKSPYTVHWFNNLWFMVRSSTEGKCDYAFGQWGIAGNYDKSLNYDFINAALSSETVETVETPIITSSYNLLSNKIKVKEKRSVITKSELA